MIRLVLKLLVPQQRLVSGCRKAEPKPQLFQGELSVAALLINQRDALKNSNPLHNL